MTYPTNYFFGTMSQTLEDGRVIGFCLQDGIGGPNRITSEDFLTLDGKIHKLDVTRLEEESEDLMSLKRLHSASRDQFTSSCDLIYHPIYQQEALIYAVLIAFNQRATYGNYTGVCIVNGESIQIDGWGFFEHVHMRW